MLVRLIVLALLLLAGCRSWENVREDARTMVAEVGACRPGDECAIVNGVEHDCTGVVGCGFPVRADRVKEAQNRARAFAEESRDYDVCVSSFCAAPTEAYCDVAQGRCLPGTEPGADPAVCFSCESGETCRRGCKADRSPGPLACMHGGDAGELLDRDGRKAMECASP
jgi:hypothetical protein